MKKRVKINLVADKLFWARLKDETLGRKQKTRIGVLERTYEIHPNEL